MLSAARDLAALRTARGDEIIDDPGQKVIDRILQGPPYRLDEVAEAALPYWLQAVRWFADVVSSLPTPAEVNRTLERRRVRSRFQHIAGPSFRGRIKEFATLREWYQNTSMGPMVITGIGGVGKSALVAQFVLSLPPDTTLLWLDFDRADLAPDDAVSVLRLLSEQAAVQLEGFTTPSLDADRWEQGADEFGAELARTLANGPVPLVVLDGFEVAQYVKQYQEIWRVLELIMGHVPTLRVIVSGRAPVKDLSLHTRPAISLNLKGMDPTDAEAWLHDNSITEPEVLQRVLDLANGVPLVLKLAVRWVETGGKVHELPEALPKEIVEGFLYQRILDRVIDQSLKLIAADVLVLRYVTVRMISEVLGDSIPAGIEAPEVFARLAREMGLVIGEATDTRTAQAALITLEGDASALHLRPEVRSAALKLLEQDRAARVQIIDQRAAEWYEKQDLDNAANAAELVYHCLRLGDLAKTKQVWREECAPLLLRVEDDLTNPSQEVRDWLQEVIGGTMTATPSIETWEIDALERIHVVIQRGLLRAVPKILEERKERSAISPLVLYDAWMRWRDGDIPVARSLLAAGVADGPIGRDRAVLGALLAAQDGDRPAADRLLVAIEDEGRWTGRQNGKLEALSVRAARLRLTTDLEGELELSDILQRESQTTDLVNQLTRFLSSSDVVLPALAQRVGFGGGLGLEAADRGIPIPENASLLPGFAHNLDEQRSAMLNSPLSPQLLLETGDAIPPDPSGPWRWSELDLEQGAVLPDDAALGRSVHLGRDLAALGWRRWRLATTSLFLHQECEQALGAGEIASPLSFAVIGTLALFREPELAFLRPGYPVTLDGVIEAALRVSRTVKWPPLSVERASLAIKVLDHGEFRPASTAELRTALEAVVSSKDDPARQAVLMPFPTSLASTAEQPIWPALLLYLLGPDPLQMLFRLAIGLPDNLTL